MSPPLKLSRMFAAIDHFLGHAPMLIKMIPANVRTVVQAFHLAGEFVGVADESGYCSFNPRKDYKAAADYLKEATAFLYLTRGNCLDKFLSPLCYDDFTPELATKELNIVPRMFYQCNRIGEHNRRGHQLTGPRRHFGSPADERWNAISSQPRVGE